MQIRKVRDHQSLRVNRSRLTGRTDPDFARGHGGEGAESSLRSLSAPSPPCPRAKRNPWVANGNCCCLKTVSALQIGTRLRSPSPTWLRARTPKESGWEAGRRGNPVRVARRHHGPNPAYKSGVANCPVFPERVGRESNSRPAVEPENGHRYNQRFAKGQSGSHPAYK